MSSGIPWCDETLNPIVGCLPASEGCSRCYAEKMALRLHAMNTKGYRNVVCPKKGWTGKVDLVMSALDKPLKWKTPKTIFVGSMSDLFRGAVPGAWIDMVMETVRACPQHTFIFLTKHPRRMKEYFDCYVMKYHRFEPNLVLGVSAENQRWFDDRVNILMDIPAAKRFISLEPMIGAIDITTLDCDEQYEGRVPFLIDSIIVGGESAGKNARPLYKPWVRAVREVCFRRDIAFMFKQTDSGVEWDTEEGFPILDGRIHTDLAWPVNK